MNFNIFNICQFTEKNFLVLDKDIKAFGRCQQQIFLNCIHYVHTIQYRPPLPIKWLNMTETLSSRICLMYTHSYILNSHQVNCAYDNVLILKIVCITKYKHFIIVQLHVRFDRWDENDHDIMMWIPNKQSIWRLQITSKLVKHMNTCILYLSRRKQKC